jgi:hypothetical protein
VRDAGLRVVDPCFPFGERVFSALRAHTLRSQKGQPLAVHVELDQCESLVRFFRRCNSSTTCLYLVRREVMSWACGAALRIASRCP